MPPRLLIVEDDRNWGRLMAGMVRPLVDPTVAATVRDAERLLGSPWAGAVIDVRLPDGSGLELAKRFRAAQRDLELMLFTGGVDAFVADDAARHGIVCADKAAGFAIFERFAAVCARLARADVRPSDRLARAAELRSLTNREQELITHELHGLSRAQTAVKMDVTENTVRSYISEILRKTGHQRMSQLIAALNAGSSPNEDGRA